MNEEIELILYKLEQNYKCDKEQYFILYKSDIKQILDYITNLQQENEFLKLNNPEMNIEHFRIVKENKRKIDNLRKENEELNRICELYSKSLYNAELTDYKSRCEKALNEINKIYFTITSNNENYSNLYIKLKDTEQGKNLLNILNGSDDK